MSGDCENTLLSQAQEAPRARPQPAASAGPQQRRDNTLALSGRPRARPVSSTSPPLPGGHLATHSLDCSHWRGQAPGPGSGGARPGARSAPWGTQGRPTTQKHPAPTVSGIRVEKPGSEPSFASRLTGQAREQATRHCVEVRGQGGRVEQWLEAWPLEPGCPPGCATVGWSLGVSVPSAMGMHPRGLIAPAHTLDMRLRGANGDGPWVFDNRVNAQEAERCDAGSHLRTSPTPPLCLPLHWHMPGPRGGSGRVCQPRPQEDGDLTPSPVRLGHSIANSGL